MKPNQIDVLALAVFRDFDKIDNTQKSRLARQLWTDIRKTDPLDRKYLDLASFHAVTVADSDAETLPCSFAASDLSAADSVAKRAWRTS